MITEMWWDGNVLLGKLLLLTSPGFHERGIVSTKGDQAANLLRLGVTLGISSRGVGSLKKVGDQNEVQDDFELICFDLGIFTINAWCLSVFTEPDGKDLRLKRTFKKKKN
jgi:hypothetical protein